MTDNRPPPAAVHPRFLNRLAETLSSRLANIENSRREAAQLMMTVRNRIDYLEKTFGLPLQECRDECDRVLSRIDALGGPAPSAEGDIEALVQQVVRLAAMVSTIDSAGFSRRPGRAGL